MTGEVGGSHWSNTVRTTECNNYMVDSTTMSMLYSDYQKDDGMHSRAREDRRGPPPSSTKGNNLSPSSFTVSDIASLSSVSTSACTASLEPLLSVTG